MSNMIIVHPVCRICGTMYEFEVHEPSYELWKAGKGYIQELLSELTADQRELLLTGTCGPCFNRLFPEDEED